MPPAGYRFSAALPLIPNLTVGLWETTADLWFELGGKGSGAWVRVPAGTLTDLASIPALARPLFNPADPRTARAAIVHDCLIEMPDFSPMTAAIAFRDALRAAGLPGWRVATMFIAVAAWTCLRRGRI